MPPNRDTADAAVQLDQGTVLRNVKLLVESFDPDLPKLKSKIIFVISTFEKR